MFNYQLLVDMGPNANIEKDHVYNEYFIIEGVRDEPYFVKEAVEENQDNWKRIVDKRYYPGLI
jgi:hypothetical protein